MALFRNKAHSSHVTIRLDPRSTEDHFYTSPDHYLSNETVSGCAIVKPSSRTAFSHAKITLKGSIKTSTDDTHNGALGKGWRTEHLPFLGVISGSDGRNATKNDDGTVRIPFRFDLSKCERLASFVTDLPPSLDSRLDGQKTSDCQYEISYSLTVTAFSVKSTLASATQKIFVLPVSPDALSAQHSDVPNEYHWAESHSSTKPRIHRLGSSGSNSSSLAGSPQIEVAGEEPESIVFNPEYVIPDGSTEVPFVVKISPRNNEDVHEGLPSRCHIKAHLVTKTHLTPDGLQQLGSDLEFMRTGGKHVTKVHSDFESESWVDISGWETCKSDTIEPFSVARFSFLYNIRNQKPPMPTFFTPLLSRRYFLELSLAFPESPHQTFRLSLPVEVAHGTLDDVSDDDRKKSRESSPGRL